MNVGVTPVFTGGSGHTPLQLPQLPHIHSDCGLAMDRMDGGGGADKAAKGCGGERLMEMGCGELQCP